MARTTSGGVAGWTGASFEVHLAVQYCAYMLVGDAVGLAPGAVTLVQIQAPEVVDDLVVRFESDA